MVVYLSKAIPQLCHEGASLGRQQMQEAAVQQLRADHSSLTWKLVCGELKDPLEWMITALQGSCSAKTTAGLAVSGWPPAGDAVLHCGAWFSVKAADALVQASMSLMQALGVFCFAGVLSRDPVHIILAPVRIGFLLLLLVQLPCPNMVGLLRAAVKQCRRGGSSNRGRQSSISAQQRTACNSNNSSSFAGQQSNGGSSSFIVWYEPHYYWRYPLLRNSAIIMQRVPHLVLAALTVGSPHSLYFAYTLRLSLWTSLGLYVYQGWVQYALALPLSVHLAASVLEWALIFYTSLRVDAVYGIDALAFAPNSSWFYMYHLTVSLLFVVVLPTLGILHMERGLSACYQQLLRQQLRTMRCIDDSCRGRGRASWSSRSGKDGSSPSSSRRSSTESTEDLDSTSCNNIAHPRLSNKTMAAEIDCDTRRSSREYVRECQAAMAANSAVPSSPTLLRPSAAICSNSVAMRPCAMVEVPSGMDQLSAGNCTSVAAAAAVDVVTGAELTSELLSDIQGSLNLAAAAATGRGQMQQAAAAAADISALSSLQPGITHLLGEQAAAAVYLAAAESAARPAGQHAGVPYYRSMAQNTPVSFMVHTDTSAAAMHALLANSFGNQADVFVGGAFPAYMDAVCVDATCSRFHHPVAPEPTLAQHY